MPLNEVTILLLYGSAVVKSWSLRFTRGLLAMFILAEEEQIQTSLYQAVMDEVDAVMTPQTLKKKQGVIVPSKEAEVEKTEMEKIEKKEAPTSTTTTTETAKPKPLPKEPIPINIKDDADKSKSQNNESEKPDPDAEPPTISSLQDENAALRARITQLQSDLHEAQDFVFSLQPRHQTLTEPEAVEEFTALCAAVEDWVDQNLGDSIDEMVVTKERLRPKDTQNLMDLIPPAGKAAFDIPNTDMDNIQAAILRFLNDVIFSQDFYCPLPSSERQFVMTVERSMRDLQPRRDTRACRHWRIETYTAAAERPGFSAYAEDRMWEISCEMAKMLRVLATDTDENLAKSFFENITKPACELARKIHLCFDEYTLEWSTYHDKQLLDPAAIFEKEADVKEKFASYEFVDLNTRKTLRERPRVEDGELLKVGWVFDLKPKLVFRKLRADSWAEGKTLTRPAVLVSLTDQKRRKKMAAPAKKGEQGPITVLGALADWLHREKASRKPTTGFFSGIF